MPWKSLNNKDFRDFLSKYTNETIPDESPFRKTYLPTYYEKVKNTYLQVLGEMGKSTNRMYFVLAVKHYEK